MTNKVLNFKLLNTVLLALLIIPCNTYSQVSHLISFELEDQFDSVHTDKDYQGVILVLVGSDRGGSEFNGHWASAIYNKLKEDPVIEKINWLGLADVSSAPFFLKGMIKSFFPKEREKWVVLDWEGLFFETYQFQAEVSNILVFNQKGKLVYQGTGTEVKQFQVENIARIIRDLNI